MSVQVKSKQRVADHGEVFTNEREVKAMVDLVWRAFGTSEQKISKTFLEPACGSGNFLVEILERKLETIKELDKKTQKPKSFSEEYHHGTRFYLWGGIVGRQRPRVP